MFLYGAETWSITKAIERRINALDQWCLRHILNITWSEHVTNSEIRRCTGQPLLSDIVRARHLKLFGHVARSDKSQDHFCALRACIWHSPKNWKRRLGRPRHTLLRTVEADLRPFNLGLASGFKKAQDRTTYRALTGTATSPTSPEWWWWIIIITIIVDHRPQKTYFHWALYCAASYSSCSWNLLSTFLSLDLCLNVCYLVSLSRLQCTQWSSLWWCAIKKLLTHFRAFDTVGQ